MTDPLADMFTQIRNAQMVGLQMVEIPFSKIKFDIAKILEKEGFVKTVELQGRKVYKEIEIALKYGEGKMPAISEIKRISKPGQRIYSAASDVRSVKGGLGIMVLTTSKGLMTDKEARKQNIGGELICRIS